MRERCLLLYECRHRNDSYSRAYLVRAHTQLLLSGGISKIIPMAHRNWIWQDITSM